MATWPAFPASSDFDLRLARCFTVVARDGNFHRAAAALHLAPLSLSRQIQRLEQRLGVRLFDRTTRGSRLDRGGTCLPPARGDLPARRRTRPRRRRAPPPYPATVGHHRVRGGLIVTPRCANYATATRRRGAHPAPALERGASRPAGPPGGRGRRPRAVPRRQLRYDPVRRAARAPDAERHRLAAGSRSLSRRSPKEPLSLYRTPLMTASGVSIRARTGRPAPDGPLLPGRLRTSSIRRRRHRTRPRTRRGENGGCFRPDLTAVPVDGIVRATCCSRPAPPRARPLVTAFRETARTHLPGRDSGTSSSRVRRRHFSARASTRTLDP